MLGLPFSNSTLESTVSEAIDVMRSGKLEYWITANVDFARKAHYSRSIRERFLRSSKILADGKPIVWLSNLLGCHLAERVAGADLTQRLLIECAKHQLSVFLFGCDPETMNKLRSLLPKKFKGLKIAGAEAPPMSDINSWDNKRITDEMRKSEAKLLLVALGCPKQEKWISMYHKSTSIPLAIGIGASLDFLAKKQIRAPEWMQSSGLEWLWRMIHNPKRLTGRYFGDFRFLLKMSSIHSLLNAFSWKEGKAKKLNPPFHYSAYILKGSLKKALYDLNGSIDWNRPLLLDTSRIIAVEPEGLSSLEHIRIRLQKKGHKIVVTNPGTLFTLAVSNKLLPHDIDCFQSWTESVEFLLNGQQLFQPTPSVPEKILILQDTLTPSAISWMEDRIHRTLMSGQQALLFRLDATKLNKLNRSTVSFLMKLREYLLSKGSDLYLSSLNSSHQDILKVLGGESLTLATYEDKLIKFHDNYQSSSSNNVGLLS